MNSKQIKFTNMQTIVTIIIAIVVLVISQLVSMFIGNLPVILGLPIATGNVLAGILYPVFTLLGVSVLCKNILKSSLDEFKITTFRLKPIWCIVAFALPVMVSIILLFIPGRWEINSINMTDKWAIITGAILYFGLATGIVEEVIFRGVIMSALEYRFNRWVAIIVPSVLFGVLHIIGNNLDFLSVIQLLVAGSIVGILFSMVTYESGSIWCSALIHGVWNMIMIGGILQIGTNTDETSIFNYVLDTKSFLITGGDFGIEASIISVACYLIFIILALFLIRKKSNHN